MGDVMDQETTGEAATAGNGIQASVPTALPNAEEKLLPAGRPEEKPAAVTPTNAVTVAPWIKLSKAADALHGGNAVAAAQSLQTETPFERNLREVGLKEAFPHQGVAPERVGAPEESSEDGSKKIRTYAADMSEEMKKRGSTLSTIIGAEKAQAQKITIPAGPAPSARTRRRGILLIGAFFFVVVGIGAVVTTIFFLSGNATTPAPEAMLISVNHRVSVALEDKKTLAETLARVRAGAALNLGEIEIVDITKNGVPLGIEETLTELGAPSVLARNATGLLVGVHAFNHTQPFIIISVSAYDFSFQAMLGWEKSIGDTLGNFFAPEGVASDNVTIHPPALQFTDRVSANVDVRQSQNEWPIVYAFPRQNLMIITTNEGTLREIMTRLSLQKTSN